MWRYGFAADTSLTDWPAVSEPTTLKSGLHTEVGSTLPVPAVCFYGMGFWGEGGGGAGGVVSALECSEPFLECTKEGMT